VPRYTSYPTAPHFSAAVGPNTYAEWLAALPGGAKLSLMCMLERVYMKIGEGVP
jgi:hypothetical protein